ncbi:MAG: hypothetical protein IJU29_04830 [Oscillospiraceae bacterium]|nr:hypothetical protein [Oscillospiraceae bacterium]
MDILKELYYGNIQPVAKKVKKGTEYKEIQSEACALEQAFCSELSDAGKEIYEAYVTKRSALLATEDCDSFIKGYRLGVKLLLAVLLDYDTPFPQVGEE